MPKVVIDSTDAWAQALSYAPQVAPSFANVAVLSYAAQQAAEAEALAEAEAAEADFSNEGAPSFEKEVAA